MVLCVALAGGELIEIACLYLLPLELKADATTPAAH